MNLESHLQELEGAQLLQRTFDPEPSYIFRHTLVQETAYETLLFKSRRKIHARVARCYERLYADNLEPHAAILARHLAEAGDDPQATFRYTVMAGDLAFRQSASREAEHYYGAALDLVLPDRNALHDEVSKRSRAPALLPEVPEDSTQLIQLFTRRGRSLELDGRYEEAIANYADMAVLAQRRSDRRMELAALLAEAAVRAPPNPVQDLDLALELSRRALDLSGQLGDPASSATAFWILSLVYTYLGAPHETIEYGQQSVALARQLQLGEQLAYSLNDLHRGYAILGDFARAREALEEAQELWRTLGNRPMLAENLNGSAELDLTAGHHDGALRSLGEARRLDESIGNRWGLAYGSLNRGVILAERGPFELAIATLTESIDLAEQVGFSMPQGAARMILALVYHSLGDAERAEVVLVQGQRATERLLPDLRLGPMSMRALLKTRAGEVAAARTIMRQLPWELARDDRVVTMLAFSAPLVWLAEAELLLAEGDAAAAVERSEAILAWMDRMSQRLYRADVLWLAARACLALERMDDAWTSLEQARRDAEDLPSVRVLWPILDTMADLAARRGDRRGADLLRTRARKTILSIADHVGDVPLRVAFLSQPAVESILAGDEGPSMMTEAEAA